jgi:catechol 2,3-dioxygenase-like lactoylglutathione lyase family enzyme
MSSTVTIGELSLADEPERWSALGFAVADDCLQLGAVRLRLAGSAAGSGIVGWSLRGLPATALAGDDGLDGLVTTLTQAPPPAAPQRHPNGVTGIDHVVAMTPDLDRSVRTLGDAGLDLRRIREQPTPAGAPRQAFFRLGVEILEVVQEPEHVVAQHGEADRPARLWGLALIAPELERTVAAMAPHVGEARAAVQPGRRIATLRRTAGLAVPVALMSARA